MKRILILTSRFSCTPRSGDVLRIHNIAKFLSSSYEVTMVTLDGVSNCPKDFPYKVIGIKVGLFERVFNVMLTFLSFRPMQSGFFESRQFRKWYAEEQGRFDACIVHLSRLARLVNPADFDISVLEFTDCLSIMYARSRKQLPFSTKWLLYLYEELSINAYEYKVFQGFDIGVFVSEVDRSNFLHMSEVRESSIISIGNGVSERDIAFSKDRNGILFIGNMRSLPNVSAVKLLLDYAREKSLQTDMNFVFHIVGYCPKSILRKYQSLSNVTFHGVSSEEHLLSVAQGCFCGVVPVYAAAGVQNKVLDYLSLGLPVVSSPCAFEGLENIEDKAILIKNRQDLFFEGVVEIFSNVEQYQKAALSAKQVIRSSYSWNAKLSRYAQLFE